MGEELSDDGVAFAGFLDCGGDVGLGEGAICLDREGRFAALDEFDFGALNASEFADLFFNGIDAVAAREARDLEGRGGHGVLLDVCDGSGSCGRGGRHGIQHTP